MLVWAKILRMDKNAKENSQFGRSEFFKQSAHQGKNNFDDEGYTDWPGKGMMYVSK